MEMSSNVIGRLTVDDLAAYLERTGADASAKEAVEFVKSANAMMSSLAKIDREQRELGRGVNHFVDQYWGTCVELDLLFGGILQSSLQDDLAEGLEGLVSFQGAVQRSIRALSELPQHLNGVAVSDQAAATADSPDLKAEEEAAYRKIFGIPDPPVAR